MLPILELEKLKAEKAESPPGAPDDQQISTVLDGLLQ
jgi:hypothetical protein